MSEVTPIQTTTRTVLSKDDLADDQGDSKQRPILAAEVQERFVLKNGVQERILWHSGSIFAFSAVQCVLFLCLSVANSLVLQITDNECEDAIKEVVFGVTALGYSFAAVFAMVLFDIGGEVWCGRPHLILFLVWVTTAVVTTVWLVIGLVSTVGSDCRDTSPWLYASAVWSITIVCVYYVVSSVLLLTRLLRSRTKREPFVTAAPPDNADVNETKPDAKEEDMLKKHIEAMENIAKLQDQADEHKAKAEAQVQGAEEAEKKALELLQEEKKLSEARELRLQEKERELERMRMDLEVTRARLQEQEAAQQQQQQQLAEAQQAQTQESDKDGSEGEQHSSVQELSDSRSSTPPCESAHELPLSPGDVLNATLPNAVASEKCSACERAAVLECRECGTTYCDLCDSRTHCSDLSRHQRHRIGFHLLKDMCQRCEELPARVICKSCEQEYCDMCFKTLHKSRRKRDHDFQYRNADVIQPLARKPPRKLKPLRARPAPSPRPQVEEGEIESQFSI